MLKAQAGSSVGLQPSRREKLRRAVDRFVRARSGRGWIERQLRPLAGLEADETSGDNREEAFAAWRRFLEAIADERPLVLAFEDLHWADDALLDFVDYLVEWARASRCSSSAPRVPSCSRRPGWGGGKVNSSTILLSPLRRGDRALLYTLLGQSAIDAELRTRLLEHAGGNPLYAEEFTRMVGGSDRARPSSRDGAGHHRRPPRHASHGREGAPQGRGCDREAFLARSTRRRALDTEGGSLARAQGVREPQPTKLGCGRGRVRIQACARAGRRVRADPASGAGGQASRAAEWIESLGRPEDHAEMLAHHYASAIEYARVRPKCRTARSAGGSRCGTRATARSLNVSRPRHLLRTRSRTLAARRSRATDAPPRLGASAYHVSGDESKERALEEARDALLAAGRIELAAEAEALLAEVWWYRANATSATGTSSAPIASVQQLPPSPGKAHVLGQVSRYRDARGCERGSTRDRRGSARDGRGARPPGAPGACAHQHRDDQDQHG